MAGVTRTCVCAFPSERKPICWCRAFQKQWNAEFRAGFFLRKVLNVVILRVKPGVLSFASGAPRAVSICDQLSWWCEVMAHYIYVVARDVCILTKQEAENRECPWHLKHASLRHSLTITKCNKRLPHNIIRSANLLKKWLLGLLPRPFLFFFS